MGAVGVVQWRCAKKYFRETRAETGSGVQGIFVLFIARGNRIPAWKYREFSIHSTTEGYQAPKGTDTMGRSDSSAEMDMGSGNKQAQVESKIASL
jgi:hypothetical protein